MVQDAPGSLTCAVRNPGARLVLDPRGGRRLVDIDEPRRLVQRVDDLDRSNHDALEWIADGWLHAQRPRQLPRQRRELPEVEVEARHWAHQVAAALPNPRVERMG